MLNNLKIIFGIILPLFICIVILAIIACFVTSHPVILSTIAIVIAILLCYFGQKYVDWFFKKFIKGIVK